MNRTLFGMVVFNFSRKDAKQLFNSSGAVVSNRCPIMLNILLSDSMLSSIVIGSSWFSSLFIQILITAAFNTPSLNNSPINFTSLFFQNIRLVRCCQSKLVRKNKKKFGKFPRKRKIRIYILRRKWKAHGKKQWKRGERKRRTGKAKGRGSKMCMSRPANRGIQQRIEKKKNRQEE